MEIIMWNLKKKQNLNQKRDIIEKLTMERWYLHRTASKLASALVFALSAIEADKDKDRGSKATVAKIEGYLRAALDDLKRDDLKRDEQKTTTVKN